MPRYCLILSLLVYVNLASAGELVTSGKWIPWKGYTSVPEHKIALTAVQKYFQESYAEAYKKKDYMYQIFMRKSKKRKYMVIVVRIDSYSEDGEPWIGVGDHATYYVTGAGEIEYTFPGM